jgi:hypothetical protein
VPEATDSLKIKKTEKSPVDLQVVLGDLEEFWEAYCNHMVRMRVKAYKW